MNDDNSSYNIENYSLEQEEFNKIFTDEYRREAVEWFVEQDNNVFSFEEVVAELTDGNNQSERRDLQTKLYHKHLPILEEAGIIRRDPTGKHTIVYEADEDFEEVFQYVNEVFE